MSHPDLHSRQRLLKEIGIEGQERLDSAEFADPPGLSEEALATARDYASRAGLSLRLPHQPSTALATEAKALNLNIENLGASFRHRSSASLALGAASALLSILDVLNLFPVLLPSAITAPGPTKP